MNGFSSPCPSSQLRRTITTGSTLCRIIPTRIYKHYTDVYTTFMCTPVSLCTYIQTSSPPIIHVNSAQFITSEKYLNWHHSCVQLTVCGLAVVVGVCTYAAIAINMD